MTSSQPYLLKKESCMFSKKAATTVKQLLYKEVEIRFSKTAVYLFFHLYEYLHENADFHVRPD